LIKTKKQWLYDCIPTGYNIFGEIEPKKELDIFVKNKGKSTKKLTINIDCNTPPIESCKEKESNILNLGDISLGIIQYEIPEINAQTEYKLILLFEKETNIIYCKLTYSSEDIIEEIKIIKKL